MNHTKYTHLRTATQAALADGNLEKAFELLAESLDERTAAYSDYIQLRGRLSSLLQMWGSGQMTNSEYNLTLNQIRAGLLNFVNHTMKPEDVSLLRRIHDRILVVACKNSPTDWKSIFNEAYFSHVAIIQYKDEVPAEFKKPDVIVFDDLFCATKNNVFMGRYIQEMPDAHILYVGKENPLEDDDPAAYERSANANSRMTIHARLREVLEYRKFTEWIRPHPRTHRLHQPFCPLPLNRNRSKVEGIHKFSNFEKK